MQRSGNRIVLSFRHNTMNLNTPPTPAMSGPNAIARPGSILGALALSTALLLSACGSSGEPVSTGPVPSVVEPGDDDATVAVNNPDEADRSAESPTIGWTRIEGRKDLLDARESAIEEVAGGGGDPGDMGDMGDGVEPAATEHYVGLSKADAEALGAEENRIVRIVRIDDEFFAVTEDYSPDRINLEIEAGLVVGAWAG